MPAKEPTVDEDIKKSRELAHLAAVIEKLKQLYADDAKNKAEHTIIVIDKNPDEWKSKEKAGLSPSKSKKLRRYNRSNSNNPGIRQRLSIAMKRNSRKM